MTMFNLGINKIKNIVIVILSAIVIYSVIRVTGYNRIIQNNNNIIEYLEIERGELSSEVNSLYVKLDSIIDNNNKQFNKLKLENHYLQSKLTNLENEMINIPSDSSYNYLMHRYIPTQDSLPYGFAPNQIKAIHFDVISFDYTKLLNSNLDSTVNVLSILSNTNKIKFEACVDQNSLLLQQNSIMSKEIESLKINNNNFIKQIKKERIRSTVFGIGATALVTYLIIK